MSCTAIQTDSAKEKPDINTSARSSPPPVYTPAQPTESPQSPQQQQQEPQHVSQQQPFVQCVMQPQPYMYPGAGGQMIVVPPPLLPRELRPNDYLIVTLIVGTGCAFFNITSLVFSIPALICSVMAFERTENGFYTTAKNLGVAAIILDMICIIWVVAWGVVVVGLLTD